MSTCTKLASRTGTTGHYCTGTAMETFVLVQTCLLVPIVFFVPVHTFAYGTNFTVVLLVQRYNFFVPRQIWYHYGRFFYRYPSLEISHIGCSGSRSARTQITNVPTFLMCAHTHRNTKQSCAHPICDISRLAGTTDTFFIGTHICTGIETCTGHSIM